MLAEEIQRVETFQLVEDANVESDRLLEEVGVESDEDANVESVQKAEDVSVKSEHLLEGESVDMAPPVEDMPVEGDVFSLPWLEKYDDEKAGCGLGRGSYVWRKHGLGSNMNSESLSDRDHCQH